MSLNEEPYGKRLVEIQRALSLSIAAFSRGLDVPRTTLVGWEEGKTVPIGLLTRLDGTYKVNPDWFLSGEGPMFREGKAETVVRKVTNDIVSFPDRHHDSDSVREDSPGYQAQRYVDLKSATVADFPEETKPESVDDALAENARLRAIIEQMREAADFEQRGELPPAAEYSEVAFRRGRALILHPTEADRDRAVLLPLLNQRASAGPGQSTLEVQEIEDLIPVVQDLLGHHKPVDCFVLRVSGDSMAEMQINHGDLVICTRRDNWGDGVYAITHNREVRLKRIAIRVSERKILIISENKRYPDPEIETFDALDDGRLVIEGKLIAWLHRHMY